MAVKDKRDMRKTTLEGRSILPLTNDLVFKAVFGRDTPESKEALMGLLNLILKRQDDPIVEITLVSPFHPSIDIFEKKFCYGCKTAHVQKRTNQC